MKLTLYVCDRCGTIMQMDELPSGWQKLPGYGVQSSKHHCNDCTAELIGYRANVEDEITWPDGS